MRAWIIAFFLLAAVTAWCDDVMPPPFTLADTQTFRMTNQFTLTNTSKYPLVDVKVSVLVGAKSTSPYQTEVRSVIVPPSTPKTHLDDLGNLYFDIEYARVNPGESRKFSVQREVRNSAIGFDPTIARTPADYAEFQKSPANARYLKPSALIESHAPQIEYQAKAFQQIASPVERAWAIYRFVNLHLTPDEKLANRGALSGLTTKRGVCTEYAALFVALCRASGIPARVVSGYWRTAPFTAEQSIEEKPYRHAWAEFYLPTVGWVPVEPSLEYEVNGERLPNRDYFARIDAGNRHFIWSYGLEVEREGNVQVEYGYLVPRGMPDPPAGTRFVEVKMIKETVEMLPSPPTPDNKPTTSSPGEQADKPATAPQHPATPTK